jgi:hypothetical protein
MLQPSHQNSSKLYSRTNIDTASLRYAQTLSIARCFTVLLTRTVSLKLQYRLRVRAVHFRLTLNIQNSGSSEPWSLISGVLIGKNEIECCHKHVAGVLTIIFNVC